MRYTFRQAVRDRVPLVIGITGGTSSGKTLSAMRLAHGLSGGKRFCVLDTENRHALEYAPDPGEKPNPPHSFDFEHTELVAPFDDKCYLEAVQDAGSQGYPVIMIDSMSHCWIGPGGTHDQAAERLKRMMANVKEGTAQWFARYNKCAPASWADPKFVYKRMVQNIVIHARAQAHLIVCFRAERKVEFTTSKDGKLSVEFKHGLMSKDGWTPVCDEWFPYECQFILLFTPDRPGFPNVLTMRERYRALFPPDKIIDEEAGRRLAEVSGPKVGKAAPMAQEQPAPTAPHGDSRVGSLPSADPVPAEAGDDLGKALGLMTDPHANEINDLMVAIQDTDKPLDRKKFAEWLKTKWGVEMVSELPDSAYPQVVEMLERRLKAS
jgi:hypothetical protein